MLKRKLRLESNRKKILADDAFVTSSTDIKLVWAKPVSHLICAISLSQKRVRQHFWVIRFSFPKVMMGRQVNAAAGACFILSEHTSKFQALSQQLNVHVLWVSSCNPVIIMQTVINEIRKAKSKSSVHTCLKQNFVKDIML